MVNPLRPSQAFIDRPSDLVDANTTPLDRVPLLDVGRENTQLEQEIVAAMTQVARSGRFIMGPECQQLEQHVANLCGVNHAIGCASGSDALIVGLMAVGIKPGDEVIVPSFTFFATASAVWRLGAIPIFVDIDSETFNIDPSAIRSAVNDNTKAIIPVHLFGQAAEMDLICEIASENNLAVIEDAAQAIGAGYRDRTVGSIGDLGCFSFYPTKNLGGFGDGGMLTTNSDELAARLRLLRVHGMQPRYYHEVVGVNSRLDSIQAAVLNVKLPNLKSWSEHRIRNARRYAELFEAAGMTQYVELPGHQQHLYHVWNQYTIRVKSGLRDQLRDYLSKKNVGTEVYYPVPLHQQACFASVPRCFELPETERAAKAVLSLPIFPTLTLAEQETVVTHIAEFMVLRGSKSYRSVA